MVQASDFLRDVEPSSQNIEKLRLGGGDLGAQQSQGILEQEVVLSPSYIVDMHSTAPTLNPYSNSRERCGKTTCDKSSLEMDGSTHTKIAPRSRCRTRNKSKATNRKSMMSKKNVVLDSNALRKRFRCDKVAHNGEEEDIEKIVQTPTKVSQNHKPIHLLVKRHVETIRDRTRMTVRRRMSRISLDVRESHRKMLEKGMTCDFKDIHDESALMSKKSFQNIANPETSTIPKNNLSRCSMVDNKPTIDMECIPSSVPTDVYVKFDHVPPLSQVERWELVVKEPISIHSITGCIENYAISICRVQGACNQEESKECFVNGRWVIDIYPQGNRPTHRCVLSDTEVSALLPSKLQTEKQVASLKPKIVYAEDVSKSYGGSNYDGVCTVQVHVKGQEVVASMLFHLTRKKYAEKDSVELKLELPIYEIIAGFGLNTICHALDDGYWFSECNREFIWSPLIKTTALVKKNESDDLSLQPFWLYQGYEHTHLHVPSRKFTCSDYRVALKTSYQIIFALGNREMTSRVVFDRLNEDVFCVKERLVATKQFERQTALPKSLSLRLTKSLAFSTSLVPGSCSIGTVGSWWNEYNQKNDDDTLSRLDTTDDTQVALSITKTVGTSRSFSTIVTTRLSLETPIPGPIYNIFIPGPMKPDTTSHKSLDGSIPALIAEYSVILSEPLKSTLDCRVPPTLTIVDFRSKLPREQHNSDKFPPNDELGAHFFSEHGYRLMLPAHGIKHEMSFPLFTFGVSDDGILPSKVGVGKRMIWHSEEVCTHLLSNPRGSSDFFHMIRNEFSGKDGGSPNSPLASTIFMEAYKTNNIVGQKMIVRKQIKLDRMRCIEEKQKEATLLQKIQAADSILTGRLRQTGKVFVELQDSVTTNVGSIEADSVTRPANGENKEIMKGYDDHVYETVRVNYFDLKCCKIRGFEKCHLVDRCNQPQMIGVIESSKVIKYKINETSFQTKMHTEFISDLMEDRFQLSHKKKVEKQNKDVLLDSDQQTALEHILKVSLEDVSRDVNESSLPPPEVQIAYASKDDGGPHEKTANFTEDDKSNKVERAIQATRHANYELLEELLDELGIEVDSSDEHGNTLLILAGQQGNKKLSKFLLRRGAYINAQNHAGNTILHYLYEYGHVDLAEYLMRKGADDSYINADGLTCYEGVKIDTLVEM